MLGGIGPQELLLIFLVALLLFGARRIPEIGSALGKGIREFKGSVKDIENEINRPADRSGLPRSESPRQGDQPRSELPRSEAPRPEESRRVEEPAQSRSDAGDRAPEHEPRNGV